MSQTVEVHFHGLMMFRFRTSPDRCQVGLIKAGANDNHLPGLAVYENSGSGGLWKLIEGGFSAEKLVGTTDIIVSKAAPLQVAAKYTDQDNPNWSTLEADDFRWVLDFERDIYGKQIGINGQNFHGQLRLNDGAFYTQAQTEASLRIVDPNDQGNPVLNRKLAAIVKANITLDQAGDQVTIQLTNQPDIVLSYRQGVNYRISVRNYEPDGAALNPNHLGLLNGVLDLTNEAVYQFHSDDEEKDIEKPNDWIYPNKRPPRHCPAMTMGRSFPVPSL